LSLKYVGEITKNNQVLCFFAAHFDPPPWYCHNTIATKRVTIKSKGKTLEKDLPLCDGCIKVVVENERGQGHTVSISAQGG